MNIFLPEGRVFDTARNLAGISTPAGLREAMAKGTILEARVKMCDHNHDLVVQLPCMKGIIPRSEGALGIAEGRVRDIALISRVNKPVCFLVTGFSTDEKGNPVALLSRRLAQKLCFDNYISTLAPGDIIDSRVTHLEPFGAFCDIGCGVISLISIDCISVSRIFHPSDRFAVGDDIKAVIKSVEPDGRVNLSHKELLGTWEENAALFSPGQTVSGIIRTVESYGSFVELTPNLAGLAEPKENVFAGQNASVFIKSILPDKMKIKLIIVDSFDADYRLARPEYFITEGHLSHWQYSPPNSQRDICTAFDFPPGTTDDDCDSL